MKKKLAMTLVVCMVAGMLAGCGNKTDNQTPGTEDTLTENPTDTEVPNIFLKDVDVASCLTLKSDYKGLALSTTPKAEVTDEQVNEAALNAYYNVVTAESGGIMDRAVAEGDTVNIDYEGKKDDVAFEGGTAASQHLTIGSGQFIDGFEEGLVGVMPGETVDLNLSFPEGYQKAELAGQAVVFTVTVNFIYPGSVELMEDALIDVLTEGDFTTVDGFLEYCRQYLESTAEDNYQAARENAAIVQLEEIAEFSSVPEDLVAKYAASIAQALAMQAARFNVDADTFCAYYFQMDAASYTKQAAEASARQGMIFQYIADAENLNVSDEELETSLQQFAEKNYVTTEELLANTDKEDYREYFMFEKVVDFLFDNAAAE